MHLKSLTLKGFKSFASATTLRFEPGITAVVGPNGSGKSNVVDAIAWVLGEQGAKALRGGKMEDVIFAGTAGRPPLGRAEVTLTIDNTDGALPIEYAEVSITRRMFRDGASDYEINGEGARLLDIQELLSDSGIGREMHVIVGQGQLDSILSARPEDRRGFIEEAAGVLKHRKRKEKALRKLDAMQANLTRLTDLTGELRRQLKPLGKQAEIARRAAGVQAELRDARLRLLADDLSTLRQSLEADVADETAVRQRRAEVEQSLAEAVAAEAELEAALAADAPAAAAAQEVFFGLSALSERFAGTQKLAAQRLRHLSEFAEQERLSRDPQELEQEAAEVRAAEEELTAQLTAARQVLQDAVARRQQDERELADAERAVLAAARAVADRREGLAKLAGQVNALRSRASAGGDEIARIAAAATQARARAAAARAELESAHGEVGALDQGELDLDARHEAALARHAEAAERLRELTEAHRTAERERSTWTARREALAMGLTRKDGAGALLAAGSRLPGLLGSVAALLSVEPGYEAALTAALGVLADAVAVSSPSDARAALDLLQSTEGGRAGLVVGGAAEPPDRAGWPALPDGARWAVEVISCPRPLRAAVEAALAQVAVVADLDEAERLIAEHGEVRAVTRSGDVLGRSWAAGGSSSSPSALEVQAAVDEADQRATEAATAFDRLEAELTEARQAAAGLQAEVEATLDALNESDARLNAVAERLAQLAQAERSATGEAERLDLARQAAESARDSDLAGLVELEERLRLAEAEPTEQEPPVADRDAQAARVAAARQAEMEARLTVRTQEERVRALAGRAEQLLRAAQAEREARARSEAARIARARGARIAAAVEAAAGAALAELGRALARAVQQRDAITAARAERDAALRTARAAVRELGTELARLTDAVHRDEVARAEHRLRIEQLETRAAEEYGIEADALLAEYGSDQPVPPSAQELAEFRVAKERGEDVVAPQPGPYDRRSVEKRVTRAERELALLGKVNPLALEEFAALEERHQFLATQLEDLKNTRRDLLTVVKEVDDRILEVFTAAYHDVAREFEVVFATLFPGGEGRLVLTEPEDMLTTGIDVEARPPGKKVKRLSLLSGGERSLTAVAMLVAIFRARPSPFYVMDEVEAALDDVNLGRLVGLIGELRSSSQLIVITHQKRTMEVADALYGVAMRGDGISQVISQRLRDGAEESDRIAAAG
ncbi:MAG TPA: chromosome segregation protein SMC [Jatrophihabitans sp.]|uniref:chromosome segregation protein SMC n=1 Tax=Jatrophihabitans sp. TaxID=1932789 RepID=UPI002F16387A